MDATLKLWLVVVAVGLLNYLSRLSFIALFARRQVPALLARAFRYVPAAMLTALVVPMLVAAPGASQWTALPKVVAAIIAGVVAFALPLHVIATMYARLPETLPRQYAAMTAHPELVRGDGDLDTEAMRAIPGCVAKGGAEGLQCFGLQREGIGIAIRVDDGNPRAGAPAALAVLRDVLSWATPPPGLAALAEPVLPNSVGDPVVQLRAEVTLERAP